MKNEKSVTVIPAVPGWKILKPYFDDEKGCDALFEQPVIAWGIEVGTRKSQKYDEPLTHYNVTPITPEGETDQFGEWFLESQDGKISEQDVGVFDDRFEVLRAVRLRREDKERRESKVACKAAAAR